MNQCRRDLRVFTYRRPLINLSILIVLNDPENMFRLEYSPKHSLMKKLLLFFAALPLINGAIAQKHNPSFQSSPKLVMEEMFRAADTQDFSYLHLLCPPDKSNDGDTQRYICDVEAAGDDMKKEYTFYFADAYITGDVIYQDDDHAIVPFWFNHPGGESRSNEKMNMVRIDGKWYLSSF